MRGSASRHTHRRGAAQSLVLLMLFSGLLSLVPAASASVSGDLAIIEGLEPMQGVTYDRDTAFIIPSVKVHNDQMFTHSNREVRWEICPGNYTATGSCPSGSSGGLTSSGSILGNQDANITFSNYIFQPTYIGIHTVSFFFTLNDNDESDDRITYTFDVASPLRDIAINNMVFDDTQIYNSNTTYPISANFYRHSWEAGQNGTFGWTLYDNGTEVISSFITTTPPAATDQQWILALPDLFAPYPGIFDVEVGLYSSEGDMNSWNDRTNFTFTVNDSVDLWVETIEPARGYGEIIEVWGGQNNTLYPLGENSIRVKVGNFGYTTVNTTVSLTIIDTASLVIVSGPTPCGVVMDPGETASCVYDMPYTGEYTLRAEFPEMLDALDINPSDNWFEVDISSRHIDADPTVSNPTEGERFDSGDSIMFVGQVSQMAAMPVNFTWRLNYEELVGYGQVMERTLPMGEWLITLTTSDATGANMTGTRTIRIQNRIQLAAAPWVVGGEGVMDEPVDYTFNQPLYPPAGFQYETIHIEGLSPLRILDFDIEPSQGGVSDPGIVYAESWIDLSQILPEGLDRTTLHVYRLNAIDSAVVEEFTFPSTASVNLDNDTLHLYDGDFGNGLYIIAGELQPTNVTPANFHSIQGVGGQLTLEWTPEGDLDNPYFGGWRIYRRITFPFFWPYESETQFWSVEGTEVMDLSPHDSSWLDPAPLPEGTCASYLIIALDRQGNPDHTHGAAAGFDGEDVQWQCGDASPPRIEVYNLDYNITFDNSSGANVHHVNVTWIWPDYDDEVNVTWDLYRLEVVPSDLTWMDPIATGLSGESGEEGQFHEWEGPAQHRLKVERTYNYILVPIDSVGNVDYAPIENNIVTLTIENQFWDHNSYLVPPPPTEEPPPYGNEWLGDVMDYLEIDVFRTTGIIALAILLLNLVMIPVVINQTRGVRRIIKRAKAKAKAERESMLTGEIAEDLEDMFY